MNKPNYYVMDLRVLDFEGAAKVFRKAFGMEGNMMWSEYEPSGTTRGIHFKTGGLSAFGILSPDKNPQGSTATKLMAQWEELGDGITLLGATAVDSQGQLSLANRQRELEEKGVRFTLETPMRVGDETLNQTERTCGVTFLLAQHDEGHWERWDAGEHVSTDSPPTDGIEIGPRVIAARAVEIVVLNLKNARNALGKILGESRALNPAELSPGLDGVEFLVDGIGVIRAVSPNGRGDDAKSKLAKAYLDEKGEGLYLLEMEVANLQATCAAMAKSGIHLADSEYSDSRGTHAVTEMLYGLAIEYTQPIGVTPR